MIRKELAHNMIKKDNVVDFETAKTALITGGPVGEENWLKDLEPGTIFLARRANRGAQDLLALDMYAVLEHLELSTNLLQKIPTGQEVDLWFDTLEFSRKNKLQEVKTIL